MCTKEDVNKYVAPYLVHSYLYYIHDVSLILDEEYNAICKKLLENFDDITHMHKKYIDKESLKANTAYTISEYPTIVKACARMAYEDRTGVILDIKELPIFKK